MNEHDPEVTAWSTRARAEWVHELRNAVNTAGISLLLGRRLLGGGDEAAAAEMFDTSEHALGRCRDLLASASAVTAPEDPALHAPRGSETPAPRPAPHWHR
jgi:hypothetical protein